MNASVLDKAVVTLEIRTQEGGRYQAKGTLGEKDESLMTLLRHLADENLASLAGDLSAPERVAVPSSLK